MRAFRGSESSLQAASGHAEAWPLNWPAILPIPSPKIKPNPSEIGVIGEIGMIGMRGARPPAIRSTRWLTSDRGQPRARTVRER